MRNWPSPLRWIFSSMPSTTLADSATEVTLPGVAVVDVRNSFEAFGVPVENSVSVGTAVPQAFGGVRVTVPDVVDVAFALMTAVVPDRRYLIVVLAGMPVPVMVEPMSASVKPPLITALPLVRDEVMVRLGWKT